MITLVDLGQHHFKLYLDHDHSVDAINMDDVVHFPVAELPPVISPQTKMEGSHDEEAPVPIQVVYPVEDYVSSRTRQSKRKRSSSAKLSEESEEEEHSEAVSNSEDEQDSDFEIVDSDNGISDGDNDLYVDNVEDSGDDNDKATSGSSSKKGKSARDKGKQKCEIKEELSDGDDLWGPNSEDETDFLRFKNFREDDLNNPKFAVGLVFANVELLRKAIRAYSCIHRKPIKLPINDKARVRAVCGKSCSWYLWASTDLRTKAFQIKRYTPEHTCSGK
jgi:hypothetical protein